MADRDEKRRLLRQKIANQRAQRTGRGSGSGGGAQALAERVHKDPMTALMSMGLDDPEVLRHASAICKNADVLRQTAKNLKKHSAAPTVEEEAASNADEVKDHRDDLVVDEEDLPPLPALVANQRQEGVAADKKGIGDGGGKEDEEEEEEEEEAPPA